MTPKPTPAELEALKRRAPYDKTNLTEDEFRDPDRQQSLKVAAVAGAFQEGKLPTTSQAVAAIDELEYQHVLGDVSRDLSAPGRKVVADTEKVLTTTKRVLAEKNPNNEIQNLIVHLQKARDGLNTLSLAPGTSMELEDRFASLREKSSILIDRLGRVSRLVVTSKEFRTLLGEVLDFMRALMYHTIEEGTGLQVHLAPAAEKERTEGEVKSRMQMLGEAATEARQTMPRNPETMKQGARGTAQELKNIYHHPEATTGEKVQMGKEAVKHTIQRAIPETSREKAREALVGSGGMPMPTVQTTSNTSPTVRKGLEALQEMRAVAPENPQTTTQAARGTHEEVKQVMRSDVPAGDKAKHTVEAVQHTIDRAVPQQTQGKLADVVGSAMDTGRTYLDSSPTTGQAIKSASRDLAGAIRESTARGLEMSEDEKNRLVYRTKEVLIELRKNPQFVTGLKDIAGILGALVSESADVVKMMQEGSVGAYDQIMNHVREVQVAAKALLENFAGGKSMDPIILGAQEMARDMSTDRRVYEHMDGVQMFLQRAVDDPEFVKSKHFDNELVGLTKRTREIMYDDYGTRLSALGDKTNSFLDALRSDDLTTELSTEWDTLVRDITLDAQGRPTLKFDLMRDLAKLLPRLADKLAYLPLPRMEHEDDQMHYIFDNLVLKCTNILPKYMEMNTRTVVDSAEKKDKHHRKGHATTTAAATTDVDQVVNVKLSKIQLSLKDIAFFYNKKKGIIAPSDVGLCDVAVEGDDGATISLIIKPRLDAKPGESVMSVVSATTSIESLDIKIRHSHHNFLYKILKPFINAKARSQIEEAISTGVVQALVNFDQKIAQSTLAMSQQMGTTAGLKARATGEVLPPWSSHAFDVRTAAGEE